MATFIDVHSGMKGVTHDQLLRAHQEDQKLEQKEGVRFIKAWADPSTGKAFCLSEGPSKEAVLRIHQQAGHPTEEIYEVPVAVE